MAFDGITVANIVHELSGCLSGGGISRIIQPEKDELLITVKSSRVQYHLLLSANASLPLIYLLETKKEAPLSAPNFCMLLRKHLQGGQIVSITQPSLERVVEFRILHRSELGDLEVRKLIAEFMGKHSNIILTDENDVIIDSIKRVPASVSSVREVLPGRKWFIPGSQEKLNPLETDENTFRSVMRESSGDIVHALYGTFTGISPAAAEEFAFEAEIEPRKAFSDLTSGEQSAFSGVFLSRMKKIREKQFFPVIISEDGIPVEFAVYPLLMYGHEPYTAHSCSSASEMIRTYYGTKEKITRIRQKSSDLRHQAKAALDRINRKYLLQEKQLSDTGKRDRYRIYGEMLNTYGYSAAEGAKELTCVNYYNGEEITIPLDNTISVNQNAAKYFARYQKLKRTAEALSQQIAETEADREQLESVLASIDIAETESDLSEIRRELVDYGFAQKKSSVRKGAKRESKSMPYSYTSTDGFEILVGKNNY